MASLDNMFERSCVQIAQGMTFTSSKISVCSLEHAVKSTLCYSVCFSHNKNNTIMVLT